jgi:hypothetical protein
MFLPLRELDKHDGFEVTFAAAGDTGGEAPIITGRMLEGHDVIVGQRLNNHKGLDIWRRARTPYSRLVLDLDDNVFEVGPENFNAYNLYNRADIQDATIHHAETSDLVTVSTEPLAEVMREYSGSVAVLPNHVPSWVLDLPRQRRDRPRVGWGGGAPAMGPHQRRRGGLLLRDRFRRRPVPAQPHHVFPFQERAEGAGDERPRHPRAGLRLRGLPAVRERRGERVPGLQAPAVAGAAVRPGIRRGAAGENERPGPAVREGVPDRERLGPLGESLPKPVPG